MVGLTKAYLPYRGKLWKTLANLAGENFGEFGDSLQIHQSLTRQLLIAPEISIFIAMD